LRRPGLAVPGRPRCGRPIDRRLHRRIFDPREAGMSNDERNIPIEYEPARPEWLEVAWLGIKRLLARRNEIDNRRQAVRVSNKALRLDQMRRIQRQPGLTPEQRELAIKRLGVRS